MKRLSVVLAILLVLSSSVTFTGCSKWFWGGAAAGAAAGGAAYEYTTKQQLDELEEDYEAGEMSKEEYIRRKEEIEEGSLIY